MNRNIWKTLGLIAFCGSMMMADPMISKAEELSGPGLDFGNYIVTVDSDSVNITKDEEGMEVLMAASQGSAFRVLEDIGDGYLKVMLNDSFGYLPVTDNVSVTAADQETLDAIDAKAAANEAADFRQGLVNYALQFVGGRYSYGGRDPHTGVDCSGFTRYVMQHGAGIALNASSGGQASQGVSISADQMQPGDLIFYGGGRSINHVAMYIGNGQIVHASTERTGIKVSAWNYRTPVKIVNVIGA